MAAPYVCPSGQTRASGCSTNQLARTIRRYRDGILAAIRLGLSNARLEGLNSKVRLISHRSFGFHGPEPLIALIHLCAGGITLDPPFTTNP